MCLCGLIIAMIDAFCPLIGRNPMGKLPDVVRPLTKEKPGEKKMPNADVLAHCCNIDSLSISILIERT